MKYGKCVLATLVIFAVGGIGLSADPPPQKDDPNFTKEQNKRLNQLKDTLGKAPVNPNDQPRYLQNVQNNLDRFLATNVQPSKQTTNALAATLVQGMNNGLISAEQTVALSKLMAKTLDSDVVGYQQTNQLVWNITPIVNQMGLDGNARTQLYAQVLRVIKTAPTYSPR
jgi:hypothetical protein